jgi:hypothetical protein
MTLTDEQCLKFRQLPCSFNDMVMSIYDAGIESQANLFDELQRRLDKGCYIDHQCGLYWMFYPNGGGLCSGKTIKELLENLTKP